MWKFGSGCSFSPLDENPFDPTFGLPSAGELMMDGVAKIQSAVVNYKGRAKREREESDEALAAFCAYPRLSDLHDEQVNSYVADASGSSGRSCVVKCPSLALCIVHCALGDRLLNPSAPVVPVPPPAGLGHVVDTIARPRPWDTKCSRPSTTFLSRRMAWRTSSTAGRRQGVAVPGRQSISERLPRVRPRARRGRPRDRRGNHPETTASPWRNRR